MKIAICVYGFPRYIYSKELLLTSLTNALPKDIEQIDIFWSCPSILVPDSTEKINCEELLSNYKALGLGNVLINFFDYELKNFYKKVSELHFSLDDLKNRERSHSATISLLYNMSKSVELAYEYSEKNKVVYDWVLLTRNDLLPYIKYFGIEKSLEKGIYNYRTSPYRTNYSQVNLGYIHKGITIDLLDSEDRAFFGSPEYMYTFRYLYDHSEKIFVKPYYYIEILITQFIINCFGKEVCNYIEKSKIEFPQIPNSYQAKKITQEELDYHIKNSQQ
jgi:hypothetical protein